MLNSSQTYTVTFTTVLMASYCYPQLPAQYLSSFHSFLHHGDPASWDDKLSILCSYQTDQNIHLAWHFCDLFTLDKRNINYTDLKKKWVTINTTSSNLCFSDYYKIYETMQAQVMTSLPLNFGLIVTGY